MKLVYTRQDHVTKYGDRRYGLDVDASDAEVVTIGDTNRKDRVIRRKIDGKDVTCPVRRAVYIPDDQSADVESVTVPVDEPSLSIADVSASEGSATADLPPVARMAAEGDRDGLIAHFRQQDGVGEKRAEMLADATLS